MKKTYRGLSVIVEILLMFSIMFAVLAIFVKFTLLDGNTYTNIFNKNGTYEQVTKLIYKKIDSVLNNEGINLDVKKLILTEDDIRRETNNTLAQVIEYLKTGDNNVKPISADIYKQRVSKVIKSAVNDISSSKDLSYNDQSQSKDVNFANCNYIINNVNFKNSDFQLTNMICLQENVQYSNLNKINYPLKSGQDQIVAQDLSTRAELEAQARAILKAKGMTEAQARQKLAEKGISEAQLWQMLKDKGYLNDDSSQNSSASKNNQTSGNTSVNGKSSTKNKSVAGKQSRSSNGKLNIDSSIVNKSAVIQDTLNNLESKLTNEAGTIIDKEIGKMNLTKIMESPKVQMLAKITSVIYKMFFGFMILPVILIGILIGINKRRINFSLKLIGTAFVLVGLCLTVGAFGGYTSEFYNDISISAVYFKDVISVTAQDFLIVLCKLGIGTFIIGLVLFIWTFINGLTRKRKNRTSI